MNRLKIAITIIAALALSSCAKEFESSTGIGEAELAGADDSGVMKGWVRIKLNGEAQPLKVGGVTRGESMTSGNDDIDRIAQELGAVEVRRVFNEGGRFAERRRKFGLHLWYDIRFEEELPVSRAASKFEGIEGIAHAQPIYNIVLQGDNAGLPGEMVYTPATGNIIRTSEMPFDDPSLNLQWHYNNDGSIPNSVVGADINVFEAWKKETGKPDVIVAVTDGGIDFNHEDLAANMWINKGEIPGNGIDDDNNGYVDDIYGWNGVTKSGTINPQSHGTHVAGTVAAVNNNGIGVGGVAGGDGTAGSGIRLMSCQIVDSKSNDSSSYVDAYTYAADNGAVISQNSWGYNPDMVGKIPQDVSDAMDYFIANAGLDEQGNQTGPMKGGVMIFSAGNNGKGFVVVPASDSRVIAVTAMSPDYKPASYSNYGPQADILSPGGADPKKAPYTNKNQVYSTDLNNTYSYMNGTSMACPHVSGVAALIVSHYGAGKSGFTAQDLKDRLLRSVRPLDPKYVDAKRFNELGVGMVDAGMIFLENTGSRPAAPADAKITSAGNVMTLSCIVPVDGNNLPVSQIKATFKSTSTGKFVGVYEDSTGEISFLNLTAAGERASFNFVGKYNTKYDFEITSVDRFGNVSGSKVLLSYTTADYVNQKPRVSKRIDNLEIDTAGEANKVTYNLSEYFTDANLNDGDVLTYRIINRNEQAVRVTVENGSQLVVVPLSKGNANVSVIGSDLDKEEVISTFIVDVKNDTVAPPKPPQPPVASGELSLYPSPVESTLDVVVKGWNNVSAEVEIYDSASRRLINCSVALNASGTGSVEVRKLAPGVYTLVIKNDGKSMKGTFVKK